MRVPKSLRNAFLSAVVLTVLFGLAGTAYTLFMGAPDTKPAPAAKTSQDTDYSTPKPKVPAPDAPVGISLNSLLSPVSAGSNTSISVQTTPGAVCNISAVYAGAASTDSGLAPKTADAYGTVSWTWTVGPSVPPGSWPVNVTCARHGKSGALKNDLQITPKK